MLHSAAMHSLPSPIEWDDPDEVLIEKAKVEAGLESYPDALEIVCNPML
jgi:hypothetical protein